MIKIFFSATLALGLSLPALSQSASLAKLVEYSQQNSREIINRFAKFLALPNVAADPVALQKNADFIMEMMNKRAISKVQLLTPATAGAAPAVHGEAIVPGATKTLIFYTHYDGQPVNRAQSPMAINSTLIMEDLKEIGDIR